MFSHNTALSPWLVAKASVVGRGHLAKEVPCQDAHNLKFLPENPAWGVAAVSDGAGSCKHSDLGSARVVDTCISLFTALLVEQGWAEGKPLPSKEVWTALANTSLRALVDDLQGYSETLKVDFHSLSATAIVVIFGPGVILLTHIGDGRAAGQRADGTWQALMTPYRGEEANVTVFVTSNIWNKDRIKAAIGAELFVQPFRAFAIMTDGCEMSTFTLTQLDEATGMYKSLNEPFAPFFDPNVAALLSLHNQGHTEEEINSLWGKLLDGGTPRLAVEPDDKTMILVVAKDFTEPKSVVVEQVVELVTERQPQSRIPASINSRKKIRGSRLIKRNGRPKKVGKSYKMFV